MHSPSFAWKDRGTAIDADLRSISGFILGQFPAGNKAIKEERRKPNKRGNFQFFFLFSVSACNKIASEDQKPIFP